MEYWSRINFVDIGTNKFRENLLLLLVGLLRLDVNEGKVRLPRVRVQLFVIGGHFVAGKRGHHDDVGH